MQPSHQLQTRHGIFSTRCFVGPAVLTAILIATCVGVVIAASVVVTDTTNVRLRVVQSDFPEGYDSQWHTHPGPAIVQVQEGVFKIYQGGCEPKLVPEGETFIEVPLVPVRAISKGPIKWTTTQILPATELPGPPTANPCQ